MVVNFIASVNLQIIITSVMIAPIDYFALFALCRVGQAMILSATMDLRRNAYMTNKKFTDEEDR